MAAGQNLLVNFITSGKENLRFDQTVRYTLLNVALFIGGLFLIVFGISVYLEGNVNRAYLDFGMALICFIAAFSMRTRINIAIPGAIALGAFGFVCANFVFGGEIRGFASLWVFSYPLLTIFVLGLQLGIIYSSLLFCAMLAATLIPGLAGYNYTIDQASRLGGVYILVAVLAIVYEQVRIVKDRRINRVTAELQVERDLISAMKDNLKQGIFLMNKDYVIQEAYSKPLETILGAGELTGKRFTEILAQSLKEKERATLEDYFGMVLQRSFDEKMLTEINPIAEFEYVNAESGETKVLESSFATVDRGVDEIYVLGALEDVTAARALEKELAAEASRREEEMRALFQVIQVEPRVFSDFIEDSEYEFERINDILKDKNLSARDALTSIYQSVHAVKSNAVILGLDGFGEKVHALEDQIKKYQEQDDISFEDILHITVELENIMKEKDQFQNTIKKIESFQTSTGGRSQNEHVMVETLSRACAKVAADTGKKAKLVTDEIDGEALASPARRVMKEILMQLVRNSVYHGIETPEEREKAGKDPEGKIHLTVKNEGGRTLMRVADDGKGLNFAKIKDKAVKQNLLPPGADPNDKNQLLKVIFAPGFSTADSADLNAGRGVGLNLVRDRIRDLHGSIKLHSEPGKGTAFNIYLPLTEEAAEIDKAS